MNTITVTFTGKEALGVIAGTIYPSVQKKIINALKGSNVKPIGARAAAIARKPKTVTTVATKTTAAQA